MQVALASFFAAGMLFLLKAFDWLLRRCLEMVINRWLIIPAALMRAVLLFGVGLPYILAAGLTYRPKIITRADPMISAGYSFDSIAFDSTDGGAAARLVDPGGRCALHAHARDVPRRGRGQIHLAATHPRVCAARI